MKESESEERKWFLITKVLTDRLTPEEHSEYELLMKDTGFRNDFEQARQYWENPKLTVNKNSKMTKYYRGDVCSAWENVQDASSEDCSAWQQEPRSTKHLPSSLLFVNRRSCGVRGK